LPIGNRRRTANSTQAKKWAIFYNPAFVVAGDKRSNHHLKREQRKGSKAKQMHRTSRCIGRMGYPTAATALPLNLEVNYADFSV
jgi:hypothetical protein